MVGLLPVPWTPTCAIRGLRGIAKGGTSCNEFKELGGWKSREMVDRYANYATTHLVDAAMRIERVRAENVSNIVTLASRSAKRKAPASRPSP